MSENITTEVGNIDNVVKDRNRVIVKTSIIGIVANVLLVIFKMTVGLLSNSIAVVLDAVNNLSDALSSIITIIGTKLASKLPDKKHPMGYGRIEYITETVVAALVLYAGISSLVESVKKIIEPEKADYSTTAIIILAGAVAVKILLGLYVRSRGKKVNSGALVASGTDALFDAIISSSVLASALIYLIFNISLEAYVGVIISGFIIKTGIEMLIDPLNEILGKRADPAMVSKMRKEICSEEEVLGAYDIIVNNYGPNVNYASAHVELPDTMTVDQVDVLTRRIQKKVYLNTGIIITGLGVYSYNTKSDEASEIRNIIQRTVLLHDWALQIHGFYVDLDNKTIRFDVVMSFDIDRKEGLNILYNEVGNLYPEYKCNIVPDIDFTDIGDA